MPSTPLTARRVERIWGVTDLPSWALGRSDRGQPIGEIWYEEPSGSDHELLVKLLFTAERLSIQVHPDDEAARAIGHRRGKDEAWLVLDAEPEAVIGLGLRRKVSKDELRAAALSGDIEQLIDWKPVRAGEIYYSPAGTIHAIGAGLTIMEIQQNLDLTYRLYDYGRPRELHLDEAVAAAHPQILVAGLRPTSDRSRPRAAPCRRRLRPRTLDGRQSAPDRCARGRAMACSSGRWRRSGRNAVAPRNRVPRRRGVAAGRRRGFGRRLSLRPGKARPSRLTGGARPPRPLRAPAGSRRAAGRARHRPSRSRSGP